MLKPNSQPNFNSKLMYRGRNDYGEIESAWIRLEAPMSQLAALDKVGQPHHRSFKIDGLEDEDKQAVVDVDFESERMGDILLCF
jgi:hypothetical protein